MKNTTTPLTQMIAVLTAGGIRCREWHHPEYGKDRIYLTQYGRDLGYVTDEATGHGRTGLYLSRREGYIAGLLRRGN